MAEVRVPQEWEMLCLSSDPEMLHDCISSVFRRLLSNLLLDFENPKYRKVKKDNNALHRLTRSLPEAFVAYLFSQLGFEPQPDGFLFSGSRDTLRHADEVFSHLERLIDKEKLQSAERDLNVLKHAAAKKKHSALQPAEPHPASTVQRHSPAPQESRENESARLQREGAAKDVAEASLVSDIVYKTLLNTGRIRNYFFEARDVTMRTMRHGRVYACTEKCGNECIEVHWHLLTGKNILYAHLAHLSADGTRVLHLGVEHGYQYNTLPGSPNFGKMIHFSEKLTDENGRLIRIEHLEKPAASCIYCGRLFSELLL